MNGTIKIRLFSFPANRAGNKIGSAVQAGFRGGTGRGSRGSGGLRGGTDSLFRLRIRVRGSACDAVSGSLSGRWSRFAEILPATAAAVGSLDIAERRPGQ